MDSFAWFAQHMARKDAQAEADEPSIPDLKMLSGAELRDAAKELAAEGKGRFHKDVNPDTAVLRISDLDGRREVKFVWMSFNEGRKAPGEVTFKRKPSNKQDPNFIKVV